MQKNNSQKYILTTLELSNLTESNSAKVKNSLPKDYLVALPGNKAGVPSPLVKEYLSGKGVDYSFRVIVFANMKGGVGKTTSAVSIATRAVQYGFKTCILDMDSQGSASFSFNMMPDEEDPIFCDIWQNPENLIMEAVKKIEENLYLLPSSLDNGLLDMNLINPASQKNAVNDVCQALKNNDFDLVIVDCPPSLGTAVISGVCAADIIVIPVCSDAFSIKGLQLVLMETQSICSTFNLEMPKIEILYTKYDKRTGLSKETFHNLSSQYEEFLFTRPIRTSTEYSKALEKNETVFALQKKSICKEDYDYFVKHLLQLNSFTSMSRAE
jgi:chromosome partitioning protein